MTYLRARYYDSGVRRFITEDPIKDGVNWYSYCSNNPVMFVDPSGMAVYIPDDQEAILEYLNYLSRDELDIDSRGCLYIKNQNMDTTFRPVGTELIWQLIKEDDVCTIRVTDGRNETSYSDYDLACQYGMGTDTTVQINLSKLDTVDVYNPDGSVGSQNQPIHIALGHELIHALRGMRGSTKRSNLGGINKMPGGKEQRWRQEEFDTVGIDHIRDDGSFADAANWYFTENSLRSEHGMYWRMMY